MDNKTEHTFFIALSILVVASLWVISYQNAFATVVCTIKCPTKLNATATSPTQITLSWLPPIQNYDKVIVGYKIEQMVGGGVFDVLVDNTDNTFPNYSVTGLKTGTTYTFRVSAVYSDDSTTDPSNWASATPTVTSTPLPTTNSSAPVNERFDFTPADGTTLYRVVLTQIDYQQLEERKEPRSIISNSEKTSEAINNSYKGIITYQNNHQISPTVPAPLVAIAVSPTEILLSWMPPEETYGQVLIGYKIEWRQVPGLYVPIEENTRNLDTKYSIVGLTTGTTYTYRVSAVFDSETTSNPSNEASATPLASTQPIQITNQTNTAHTPHNNTTSQNTSTPLPIPTINIRFDFISPDGTIYGGAVLTQAEYQQLIVIKDPRSIISNVTQTTNTINNDLAGILKFQGLHIPEPPPGQTSNYTQPPPSVSSTSLDIRVVEGVITSVIASGAVGIVTWLVRTKVAKKIAREYHFTMEKFVDDAVTHIRVRNSGQTIEDCIILCDKEACFWTDTNLDKPKHILEGSISVARLPTGLERDNPVVTIKSGKKVLRKTALNEMAHG